MAKRTDEQKLATANRIESVARRLCYTGVALGHLAAAWFFLMAGFLGADMVKTLVQALFGRYAEEELNAVLVVGVGAGPAMFLLGGLVCAFWFASAGISRLTKPVASADEQTTPKYTVLLGGFLIVVGIALAMGSGGAWVSPVLWKAFAGIAVVAAGSYLVLVSVSAMNVQHRQWERENPQPPPDYILCADDEQITVRVKVDEAQRATTILLRALLIGGAVTFALGILLAEEIVGAEEGILGMMLSWGLGAGCMAWIFLFTLLVDGKKKRQLETDARQQSDS